MESENPEKLGPASFEDGHQGDIRDSDKRYRLILDSSLDAIVTIDAKGLVIDWNRRAESMFGWSAREIVGQPMAHFIIPPQYREAHERGLQKFLETGAGPILNRRIEISALRRNGEEFPVELAVSPARIGGGWMATAFLRDLTAQKAAENRTFLQYATIRILSNAHSLEEAAPALLDAVIERTPWEIACLWTLDRKRHALRCADMRYIPNEDLKPFEESSRKTAFPPGVGLPGRVWKSGISTWIQDLSQDPNIFRMEAACMAGLKSAYAFPIFLNSRILGVLEFFSSRELKEDAEMAHLFASIGRQVAQFLERREMEEELHRREEQLELIIDAVPALISYVDKDQRYRFNNRAYEQWFGHPRSEILGRSIREVLGETAYEKVRDNVESAIAGQESSLEDVLPYKGGGDRYVRINYIPHRRRDGRIEGYVALIVDLTDRRKMEEDLRESQARLSLVFNNASDWIALIGVEEPETFRCLEANDMYLAAVGLSRGRCIGKTVREILSPEAYAEWQEKAEEAVRSCKPVHFEAEEATSTWRRILEHQWTPICNADGRCTHILTVAHDISVLRQKEEDVRQLQKMEAIGRLTGGIAHDFNNLLTAINGYSSMALAALEPSDPLYGQLEEINRAGERAASLTRQLLAFSRKQVLAPKILDLNAVVSGMDTMLRRLIGENIRLETRQARDLRPIKVDPGQMEQVILNLVLNARDAMPHGGRLTLETANVELDESHIGTRLEMKPGLHVMLAVTDSGTGMAPEVKARLFEPYFTTKEMGRGTGMGLATVHGIVKQSGGNIYIYSEPGRGSSFKIYFPAEESWPSATPEKIPSLNGPFSSKGNETILVVEDEEIVRTLIVKTLVVQGYRVLESSNGEEALGLAKRSDGPIHLLLTDVVMTGMSGMQMARRFSALHPEAKVAYMSGYTDNAIIHHGVLESGVIFLQKPFSPDQLSQKVRGLLDSERLDP